MRMIALLACVSLAGCEVRQAGGQQGGAGAEAPMAEASRGHDTVMNAIERQVVLPSGALPLERYARFYAAGEGGRVVATYVSLPAPEWPIGERRWVDSPDRLPMIDDGGCSVVSIAYDPGTRKILETGCNGPPPPDGDRSGPALRDAEPDEREES